MSDFAFVTAPLAGKMLARTKSPTFTGSLEQEQKKAGNKKVLKQELAWQNKTNKH